jgi:CheY-like chemotaxis protein
VSLAKTPQAARPPGRPVLLVEDDTATREAMTALFAGAGLRVIASDEGRKALELAGATRPALVVLDLSMHGMSGWEFLERRGDEPALAGIPVVVVTGSRGMPPGGAAAVLRKPVDPDRLLATVRGLLQRAAGVR